MPGDQVAELFRLRHMRRMGQHVEMNPELDAYGEQLGVAPMGGGRGMGTQTAATNPPVPSVGGGVAATTAGMPAMTAAQAPTRTSAPMVPDGSRTGIPALDELSQMPRKPTRGLVHDRVLGRVMRQG